MNTPGRVSPPMPSGTVTPLPWQLNQTKVPCTNQFLAHWNAPIRRALTNGVGALVKGIVKWPYHSILPTILLLSIASIGVGWSVFSTAPDADFLDLWMLPGQSYQQTDKATYESQWGKQHLDQIVVTSSNGISFIDGDGKASESLIAAYNLFDRLTNEKIANVDGVDVGFEDVCYQPAAAGGDDTCFNYNPFAWWGNDRDALEQDETVPITLGKYEAEGDLTGLLIRRMEVFGGITESGDNDGAVAQFDALLFWVFVDVAATKMAAPVYNASVDAWEQAVLRICAEVNSNPMVPLSVYAKVDSSIQAEVEKAVNADMPYVFAALALMFVLLMLTLYWMDQDRWLLAFASTSMLGFSVMAQLGVYGWLVKDAHMIKFGGTALICLVTMTTGFIHRVVLTREVKLHAHLGHPAAFEMITDQFFAPMVMISLCYSVVFTFCAIHVETPGIKAYAAAAAAGMLCDGIGMLFVGSIAVWWKLKVEHERERGARQGLLSGADAGGAASGGTMAKSIVSSVEFASEAGAGPAARSSSSMSMNEEEDSRTTPTSPKRTIRKRTSFIGGRGPSQRAACEQRIERLQNRECSTGVSYLAAVLVVGAVCVVSVGYGGGMFADGWVSNVPTTGLVPKASYVYDFSDVYDANFGRVPMPIDFLIDGVDVGDPKNGPLILAAANVIKASPLMNATSFRNWYEAYIEFCSVKVGWGCTACSETMVDGFPTNASYTTCFPNYFSLFILDENYQKYAADMGLALDGTLGTPVFTGVSKFGVYLNDGGIQFYPEQLALPAAINDLTTHVNEIFSGSGSYGTNVFGYSAAFPYFETWEPAHDDLVYVAEASIIGGAVLSLFVLGVWAFLCHSLVLLAGACAMLSFAMLGLSTDMNLVTAVTVFQTVPVLFSSVFYIAFRYTTNMALQESSVAALRDFQTYWREIVVPSGLFFLFVAGVGCLAFFACKSPINVLFVVLHEVLVCVSALMAVVLLPVLLAMPLVSSLWYATDVITLNN